ncbi:unnamed protein product [Amaranthus hypochondriacus]
MGPNEPYWRTNTSFSPPPSRWDYTLQSEGLQYGSSDSIQLFGSASTNSKESRNWIRGGYHPTHHYSTSDGGALYFSSPSDASLVQPWTPPPVRGVSIDEFVPSHRRGAETTVSFHSGYCFGLLLSVHAISSQLGVSVTDSKLKGWGHLIQKTVDLIVFTIKCMLCCY